MSTTTATSSAPRPVEASAKPAQAGARAQDHKPEGGDIFASLLSLLANTQVLPEAATAPGTTLDATATNDKEEPDSTENPLAALLGWGLPGAADAALGHRAAGQGADDNIGLPGAAWSIDRTATATIDSATLRADGQIDISDMTPVESTPLEFAPKGAVALPANAVRPGSAFVPTVRAPDAAAGNLAGTPWRHASLASTETLAIQQAAHQAAQTASVRSTVALDERFGAAPGVPLASTEQREVTTEGFGLTTSAGGRAPEATTALPGAVSGEGAAGSDNTGADAGTSSQSDGQADNPFAEANAGDEPTVTHWGNQHLRHASLRVGGEAGEQAIDIQLSMKGQEVQVEFKTDSAEARASLRENAGESLGDLLGRSGIQLGGVSVGAQGQPGARSEAGSARQNGVRGVAQAINASSATPARQAQTSPRADGSQPLDVFA
ncbi:flagellar hook-length control protein FliK [Hydrogenophaga sp. PBL-H3]|uniref:flagellar hook-length control protein FliK n=1 Tax=Hydrogenophaga sp. PBL-H3 TaxID=434010 RepID=UPI00131F863A|nr:flagellar hook-length control protein FliK [Hydrogenophaga sp. PBL-H3]QHE77672.1 flagellar hook-length control protein FliK [Hydrogenophaga sp. PBL-H3]QHE82096.1 flagellar hook-length control protein FliK [Hydrogenophaga sp. PBL-H3]